MPWADRHVEALQAGNTVQFRPHGNSMQGRISSGQLVTVAPLEGDPEIGDAVLCRVAGSQYVHLVKATRGAGAATQWLIGNNKGGINGWIGRQALYGVVQKVED
jgi:hypothetical protein